MGVGVRQEKGQAEKQKVCTEHCCTESPSPRDSTDVRRGTVCISTALSQLCRGTGSKVNKLLFARCPSPQVLGFVNQAIEEGLFEVHCSSTG